MQGEGPVSWQPGRRVRRRTRALIIIVGALALMAIVAADLIARHHRDAGQITPKVIAAGYARSRVPDAEALADERLTGNESEAGYRWAESHGLDDRAQCPDYTRDFRDGCTAYVNDQAR